MKILIINGPNLNLLGEREPEVYGQQTFNDYFTSLQFKLREVELSHFQSNHEGEIIDKLHEARLHFDGVVLNAAAYTHTSVAIADAVKAINIPVVEVHISNTSARENFRKHSYIAPYASGVITGFGMKSYELAVLSFVELPEKK
ncbi:type II 3-dehydroquinate dehydratase [Mesonia sp.]|uniref:type II 3-dehydroquinate dehydratase n=1 Tax=Mesonia sp. TaxID=1960830 RepID=UPI001761CE61|nr:type II 3-dehydroquinate dehydratase [Mesonia sp.]HIB36967.1 type II 3-dehydroquinate dehydratase [Mesonia sp.]HIO26354.1 type II 3-dehydroquinate dehydratase [Flavobacteriaceae bacterium]